MKGNAMAYNHGTKSMKAKLGNTIETPYGMDRSDLTGSASEERGDQRSFGGGGADLSASIKGATAKQGNSN